MGVALADPRVATDIPSRAAPPGHLPRRAARDDRPGGDVRAGDEGDAPRAAPSSASARPRPPRSLEATREPARPVYLEIATDLLAAELPERGRLHRHARAAGAERRARRGGGAAGRRRAAAAVGRRRRARGGRRGRAAGRAARRAGADDLRRRRRAAARRTRASSGCRRTCSCAGRLWDEADVVVAIGSDLDGIQTQNFAMPQPPALIAVNLDPRGRRRRTTASTTCSAGDAAAVTATLAERVPERDGLDALLERLHEVRASGCGELDGRALRFLDAMRVRAARRRHRRRRHVHPRLLARGLLHAGGAAQAADPARLGHARLRVPGRARRGARGRRPGRRGGRRRRLPVRLRRAGDDGAGEDPSDRRGRRRRRLRDAALRPGRGGRASATASTCRRPTSRRWRGRSASARRPSTGSTTTSARRWPSTWPTPSRRCWWRARRTRWCRRPTRRRTGTAAAADGPRAGAGVSARRAPPATSGCPPGPSARRPR